VCVIILNCFFVSAIASFMIKSLNPSKEINTFGDFKKQATNPIENFLIGVFNSKNDNLYKIFEQLTFKYPETFSFFYTLKPKDILSTIPLKGIKAPVIIAYYHEHIITQTESNFRLFTNVSILLSKRIFNRNLVKIHFRKMEI
jgi:hypothetical protein